MLDTILGSVRRLLRSPQADADVRTARPRPAGGADDRGRPAAVAGGVGPAPGRAVRRRRPRPAAGAGRRGQRARSATPSCTSRSTSSASGSPRSRSTSAKASARSAADGKLTFVNRAAADMIELPSLNITATDAGRRRRPGRRPTSCSFRPARPCARPHHPRGRRPVPGQGRRHHPGGLHGVGGHERRRAVGRGDRLPRHHRAQGLRGRTAPSRLLRQPHRAGEPAPAGGTARPGAAAVGPGPQDPRADLRRRGPLQEHQRQPRPRDRRRVPGRDRRPHEGAWCAATTCSPASAATSSWCCWRTWPGWTMAVAAARRICAAVEQPMVLSDGYEVVASVSVGIALTEPGKTADDVLRDADVAMYDAKAKGGGGLYKVFDQASMGTPLVRAAPDRGRPAQGARAGRARGALPAVLLPGRARRSWAPRRWCGGVTRPTA